MSSRVIGRIAKGLCALAGKYNELKALAYHDYELGNLENYTNGSLARIRIDSSLMDTVVSTSVRTASDIPEIERAVIKKSTCRGFFGLH